MKKLEDELGVQLFERGGHDLRVTPVGDRVVEQAHQALEATESVRRAARSGRDQLSDPLRIGAIYTIGPYLFPDLITKLSELAPNMPLLVEENFTSVLGEKLKKGALDVIIISLPFEEPNILTLTVYPDAYSIRGTVRDPAAWRTSFPRPKAIDVLQQAIAASQLTCIRTRIRRSRRN